MGEKNTLENLLSDSTSSDLRLSASRVSSFIQNGPSVLEKRKKVSNEETQGQGFTFSFFC